MAGGAHRLEWSSGTARASFLMAGLSFSESELRQLLSYLLGRGGSESLRHLATAVNASVGVRAREVRLYNWDGQQGLEMRWSPTGCRCSPWAPPGSEGPFLRFELERIPYDVLSELYAKAATRDLWAMLRGQRPAMDTEQSLLYDRCPCCPVPLWINGQAAPGYQLGVAAEGDSNWQRWLLRLKSRLSLRQHFAPGFHLCHSYTPSSSEPGLAPPRVRHCLYEVGRAEQQNYRRILALPYEFQQPAQLIVVQAGVILAVTRLNWSGPGALLYTADAFETDLTGLQIVRSQANLDRCRELGLQVVRMAETVVESSSPLPQPLRLQLQELARTGGSQAPTFA